jgi:predicted acetyltransferase
MVTTDLVREIAASVRAAKAEERQALESLVQLYCYDLSAMFSLDVRADGRFAELNDDLARYWVDPWRHPLFIVVGDALAGFALVLGRSRLTGAHGVFDMAEFFVMKRYRRQGVGRVAAFRVFETFRGPWELRQRKENEAATSFWRKVIAEYTEGEFSEASLAGPPPRVVQRFSTASPST